MLKYLEFLNCFSQTPALKIKGKKRPFSIFGYIIGFLTFSIILTAIAFILNDYFTRMNYTYNSYTDNLAFPEINFTDFKIGMKITNGTGGDYPDLKKFFKMSAVFYDIYIPKLGDNTTSNIVKLFDIPFIKCEEYNKNSLLYKDFSTLSKNYKDIVCLDFASLNKNLAGAFGKIGKYKYIIFIYFSLI